MMHRPHESFPIAALRPARGGCGTPAMPARHPWAEGCQAPKQKPPPARQGEGGRGLQAGKRFPGITR